MNSRHELVIAAAKDVIRPDETVGCDRAVFRTASRLLLAAGCAVPVFFAAAMIFCVGGYSWIGEFISASGRTVINGRPNTFSAVSLSCGLVFSGVLCGGHFVVRAAWSAGGRLLRWTMGICGVIGACGLVGIGLAPFDRFPDLHNFFTLCWIPFVLAILLSSFTPSDRFGTRREKLIWLVFMLYGLTICGALCWLIGRPPCPLPFRPTGPLVQKILVVGFYVYMMGQIVRMNMKGITSCTERRAYSRRGRL